MKNLTQNQKTIYLDHAATTPMLPSVRERMAEVMAELSDGRLGNPAALHSPGTRSRELLEDARHKVAELIGASPEQIIFTSGGTEANNTVINLFAGQPITVSSIEHPSVLTPARALAGSCELLPVDQNGGITETAVHQKSPNSSLYSVMLANNELGTIEPVTELYRNLAKTGAKFHTDATQAVGKIPLDAKSLGVDYLTFSSHKLGGPVGIGALYVKSGYLAQPLLYGGHQERGFRAGTSNVLLAAGFAEACMVAKKQLAKWQEVRRLRNTLAKRILAEIPYAGLNTPLDQSVPHILNMSFAGAEGESIQLYLDAEGIAVSTGSACASGNLEPSHVLMATHHDAEIAHSSIRFSFGLENTAGDIERVMQVLPRIIKRLQDMSTVKPTRKENL